MSKIRRAVRAVAGLVNDVVPNEIKPLVKVGLALIPGVGPAVSAAYTAADAYGGGASLGNALGQGVKSFAISQVAGAASKALGLSSTGNDLTDALGMTSKDGIMGLGEGAANAAQTLGASGTAATTAAASTAAKSVSSGLSSTDSAFLASAKASANAIPAANAVGGLTGGESSLFTLENAAKVAAIGGSVASAGTLLAGGKDTAASSIQASSAGLQDEAALAAEEEARRKRKGSMSNIYTSPLGLGNGQSAAAQLLG